MADKIISNNEIVFNFLTTTVSDNSGSINVPVSDGTYGIIAVGLVATLINKNQDAAAREPIQVLNKYSIIDSTDFLFKQEFGIGGDGSVTIGLDGALSSTEAIRFYRNYAKGYTVALKIIIEIPKNDNYDYSITSDNIEVEWEQETIPLKFRSIDYSNYNDNIYLEALGSTVTNFIQLKTQYKTAEETYLQIKKRYESEVVSNIVNVELPTNDSYEPINFAQVITRLLEFQAGTLVPGMSHAKSLNLETEYKRLDTLNKIINNITRMYPKITIDDGEGIPYDRPIEVILQA